MTPTTTESPFTLSAVLDRLHIDRGRALLIGLCVVLLIVGVVAGRAVGGESTPTLQTPALVTTTPGTQSPLVVPAPITIPQRATK